MLKRNDTPWYPNMRLFRQPVPGDWNSVIEVIANELEKVVSQKASLFPTVKSESKKKNTHSDLYIQREKLEREMNNLLEKIKHETDKKQTQKLMRKWYLISQLHEEINEKIEAYEELQ